MEYIKPVVLDLEEKFLESVKVIQGDTARSILFSICSDGKPFDLTGKIVRVYAIKPDKESIYNELEITNATEGLAKLKLTSQMLAVAGKLKLILVISQGTDVLSSNSIFFTIDPTIKDDSALESTSEYSAFTTALSRAQSVEASFGDMLDRLDTIVDADLIEQVVAQYIQDNGVELTGDSVINIVNDGIQNGEIKVNAEVSDSEISQAVDNYLNENQVPSIDDITASTTSTYSSSKIDTTYSKKTELHTHTNKTVLDLLSDNNGTLQYNGADITGGSTATVDLSNYQTKTDNSLTTTAKTIVDAINEVKQTVSIKEEEISNLSSQMDTKANKAETKDIQQQINNLVLGAVGDGNNAEVVQARGIYGLLNDRISRDTVSAWKSIIISDWTDGKYLNGTGSGTTNYEGYSISDYIPVGDSKKVRLRNIQGNSTIATIRFYTGTNDQFPNQKLISNIIIKDTLSFKEIDIPNNAVYFQLSKQTTNTNFSVDLSNEIVDYENDISSLINWIDGYFIKTDGTLHSNSAFMVSDYIEVTENITIKGITKLSDFPNIAFYDKNKAFKSSVMNIDSYTITGDDVNSGYYYFRISTDINTDKPIIKVSNKNLYGILLKLGNEILETPINVSDYVSLTSGYIDKDGSVLSPFKDFRVTALLKAVGGTSVSNIVKNALFPNIAFYDKNLNFINDIKNIDNIKLDSTNIPENAIYFRISTTNDKNLNIEVPLKSFYNDIGVFKEDDYSTRCINVPKYIDAVVDTETTIYMDGLLLSEQAGYKYNFTHSIVDKGVQFTPTEIGNLTIDLYENTKDYKPLQKKITTVRVVNKTDNNDVTKNIIIIGDSLIDNDYTAKETYRLLAESGASFNQLGTRGPVGGKHEGHGGWSWEDYFKETYDGKTNAFYNNGGLDFKNYCNVNGYSGIDYAIIAMGTNDVKQGEIISESFTDSYIDSIVEKAKAFVNKLLSDYPNCKIAIGLPSVGGDQLEVKNCGAFAYKMKKLNNKYIETFDNGAFNPNVTTVAHGLFINRRLGYKYTDKPISKRFPNETVKSYTEFIHSNPEGYYCYADAFYAKIRSWLNGNL